MPADRVIDQEPVTPFDATRAHRRCVAKKRLALCQQVTNWPVQLVEAFIEPQGVKLLAPFRLANLSIHRLAR